MLGQLLNVAKAVPDMHKASNDLRRARQISDLVKNQLSQVAAALPSAPASPGGRQRSGRRRADERDSPLRDGR